MGRGVYLESSQIYYMEHFVVLNWVLMFETKKMKP